MLLKYIKHEIGLYKKMLGKIIYKQGTKFSDKERASSSQELAQLYYEITVLNNKIDDYQILCDNVTAQSINNEMAKEVSDRYASISTATRSGIPFSTAAELYELDTQELKLIYECFSEKHTGRNII